MCIYTCICVRMCVIGVHQAHTCARASACHLRWFHQAVLSPRMCCHLGWFHQAVLSQPILSILAQSCASDSDSWVNSVSPGDCRLTRRSSSKCVPSYAMKHVKASVMAVVLDAAGCETWNLTWCSRLLINQLINGNCPTLRLQACMLIHCVCSLVKSMTRACNLA